MNLLLCGIQAWVIESAVQIKPSVQFIWTCLQLHMSSKIIFQASFRWRKFLVNRWLKKISWSGLILIWIQLLLLFSKLFEDDRLSTRLTKTTTCLHPPSNKIWSDKFFFTFIYFFLLFASLDGVGSIPAFNLQESMTIIEATIEATRPL